MVIGVCCVCGRGGELKGSCVVCVQLLMFENSTQQLKEKLVERQEIMHRNVSQSMPMYIYSIVSLKRKKNI